jgi:hypothetical protein
MPYRYLPNSDNSRLTAVRKAYEKASSVQPSDLPFSTANRDLLNTLYPKLNKEISERGSALSVQSSATKALLESQEKMKIYISHFFQVFNLGIDMGKYKASERGYFQLDISQESVPDLKSVDNICLLAGNIINGDPKRVAAGCAEMANPSTAEVGAVFQDFSVKLTNQSTSKDIFEKEQKDVDNLRAEADELIRDIWDEIEFAFRKDEPSAMRRKAREFGVVYASRPGEVPEEGAAPETPQSPDQPK